MDRISELHESVLLRILCLLPIPDVIRTTVLSKRWNSVLDSLPLWDFNLNYWKSGWRISQEEASKKCLAFAFGSLTRMTRNGVSTPKINLNVVIDSRQHGLLTNCVDMAVGVQVKDLTLHIDQPYDSYKFYSLTFALPLSIFASTTLTVLELWGCGFSNSVVQSNFANHTLRKLSLFRCRVSEAEFEFLFHCFTFVEDLTINNCSPVPVVSVSGLPKLKVLYVKLIRGFSVIGRVEINAPTLQRLHINNVLTGNDMVERIVTNCPLMEDLTLLNPRGLVQLIIPGSFNVHGLDSYKVAKAMDRSPTAQSFLSLKVNVCPPLKEVAISGLISRLSLVVELRISGCHNLEKVDISSHVLKSIYLDSCRNLNDIRIKASRLKSFQYTAYQAPLSFTVVAPCPLEIELKQYYQATWDDSIFLGLNAMLSQLDLATEIKLSIPSCEPISSVDVSELRRRCIFSSRNLDELRISVGVHECHDLPSVIDFLLWSYRPKSVCVCGGFQKQLIKVMYEKIVGHNPWNVEVKTVELLSKRGKWRSWNFNTGREQQLPPLEVFADLLRNFGRGEAHFTFHWPGMAEGQSG